MRRVSEPGAGITKSLKKVQRHGKVGFSGLLLSWYSFVGWFQRKTIRTTHLGPPVERLKKGYPFLLVCFSRGTLPQKG